MSNASDFFSLADGGSAEARLAQQSMDDGRADAPELAQRLLSLLTDLAPPHAFCVRLLNPVHPDYEAVEGYFCDVVDPVMKELGYRTLDLGHEPQELAWMNSEIFERLHYAQLAFVDLTAERPNCFIELGYALGRAHTTIITAKQGTPTPFDVDKLPWHRWNPAAPREAERQALRSHIRKFGALPRWSSRPGWCDRASRCRHSPRRRTCTCRSTSRPTAPSQAATRCSRSACASPADSMASISRARSNRPDLLPRAATHQRRG